MDVRTWPERDQPWLTRYRRSMTGKPVPPDTLEERERELLDAVLEAGVPAAELFGDARALAAEDVAELATAEEAVRTSQGGGLRPALLEVGGTMTGIGAVAVIGTWFRNGWVVDVGVASALVAASVAAVFVCWAVARALFSAGRPLATVGVLVAAGAVAFAGIAWAVQVGAGPVAARDVPLPLLALGLLAPGCLVLATAARAPQPRLRQDWDEEEWLHRFSSGLRTRLVPTATALGHVDELREAVRTSTASVYEEFGHPLVLARHVAEADRTARARRWWLTTTGGTVGPLAIGALVQLNDSWGVLTSPLAVLVALTGLLNLLVRWSDRPWASQR